jgi:hypothetical protein
MQQRSGLPQWARGTVGNELILKCGSKPLPSVVALAQQSDGRGRRLRYNKRLYRLEPNVSNEAACCAHTSHEAPPPPQARERAARRAACGAGAIMNRRKKILMLTQQRGYFVCLLHELPVLLYPGDMPRRCSRGELGLLGQWSRMPACRHVCSAC